MKFRKDILRLPTAFLPVCLTALLSVFLVLISASLRLSCETALETIDESYAVSLTVTTKNLYARVQDENGAYYATNTNTKKIDRAVLDGARALGGATELSYITGEYELSVDRFCTEKKLAEISKAMEVGTPFRGIPIWYAGADRILYTVITVGCTDESMIKTILNREDFQIIYHDGCTLEDGVLLPKALYDLYQAPDTLIFGWYKHDRVWPSITDASGNIKITDDVAKYMEELLQMQAPPKLSVPVAGYYEEEECPSGFMICAPEIWETLYAAESYYGEIGAYTGEDDPVNAFGLSELHIMLDSASKAIPAIQTLMDTVADPEHYLITADDYDYKFACGQLNGVRQFSNMLYMVSIVFGILTVTLALHYAVSKRRREVYTMRTLGFSKGYIIATISLQNALVLFASIGLGIGFGQLFGTSICALVERMSMENATSSVDNISRLAQLMKNSEEIKMQLTEAVEAYVNNAVKIEYAVPPHLYAWIAGAGFVLVLYAVVQAIFISNHSLIKRGKSS